MKCKRCRKISFWDGPAEFAPLREDFCSCLEDLQAEVEELQAENKAFKDALDPNLTKYAYIGNQSFDVEVYNHEEEDCESVNCIVPWTTTKDIMKMILDRATQAKAEGEKS